MLLATSLVGVFVIPPRALSSLLLFSLRVPSFCAWTYSAVCFFIQLQQHTHTFSVVSKGQPWQLCLRMCLWRGWCRPMTMTITGLLRGVKNPGQGRAAMSGPGFIPHQVTRVAESGRLKLLKRIQNLKFCGLARNTSRSCLTCTKTHKNVRGRGRTMRAKMSTYTK